MMRIKLLDHSDATIMEVTMNAPNVASITIGRLPARDKRKAEKDARNTRAAATTGKDRNQA